jgi:hypothetical protein
VGFETTENHVGAPWPRKYALHCAIVGLPAGSTQESRIGNCPATMQPITGSWRTIC